MTMKQAFIAYGLGMYLSGCMAVNPQLEPTNFRQLETIVDRHEREEAFSQNLIVRHDRPEGVRFSKGSHPASPHRSWQSLNAILRSDANSSAALPYKHLRAARVLTALAILSSMVLVAGAAASAREGLDLQKPTAQGMMLLTGGLLTVGFGVGAGISYNRARKGYEKAVDIYNDSLGMRLGILSAEGSYLPFKGGKLAQDSFIGLPDEAAPSVEDSQPLKNEPTTNAESIEKSVDSPHESTENSVHPLSYFLPAP